MSFKSIYRLVECFPWTSGTVPLVVDLWTTGRSAVIGIRYGISHIINEVEKEIRKIYFLRARHALNEAQSLHLWL